MADPSTYADVQKWIALGVAVVAIGALFIAAGVDIVKGSREERQRKIDKKKMDNFPETLKQLDKEADARMRAMLQDEKKDKGEPGGSPERPSSKLLIFWPRKSGPSGS